MKITPKELKQIIEEEVAKLQEAEVSPLGKAILAVHDELVDMLPRFGRDSDEEMRDKLKAQIDRLREIGYKRA